MTLDIPSVQTHHTEKEDDNQSNCSVVIKSSSDTVHHLVSVFF